MASLNKTSIASDDEEDLEQLRMLALQSLKNKSSNTIQNKTLGNVQNKFMDIMHKPLNIYKNLQTFGAAQTTRHHPNRGFRNNSGRQNRNGANVRNWSTPNPNLIPIQPVDLNTTNEQQNVKPTKTTLDIPKLILPQDRYHKTQEVEAPKEKEISGNKFDRYDNSDDSDSDMDDLVATSTNRERKNSIDALIDELDNEINFLDRKDCKEEKIEEDSTNLAETEDNLKELNDTLVITDETYSDLAAIIPEVEEEEEEEEKSLVNVKKTPPYSTEGIHSSSSNFKMRSRSRSPYRKSPYNRSPRRSRSRSPPRSPSRKHRYSSPYIRPLSPLSINPEDITKKIMAPLSPRSAAFVIKNQQILAQRQRSRSRSRDRSLTPRRRSRSRSLTPRKRSKSPKYSPKRRSVSPRSNNYHRRSPNNRLYGRNSNSPINKPSIHKRLGVKSENINSKRRRTSRSISLSLSPSPDRNYHKRPLNETTGHVNPVVNNKKFKDKPRKESPKPLDPILEARKKKFESPVQINKNNGIIKLKSVKSDMECLQNQEETASPCSSNQEEELEIQISDINIEEEATDDLEENILDLNPVMDIFSDEESDTENEGRFKSCSTTNNKVNTISIRNLTKKPTIGAPLLSKNDFRSDRRHKKQRTSRRKSRSTSPNSRHPKSKIERTKLENQSSKSVKVVDQSVKSESTIEFVKKRDKNENPDENLIKTTLQDDKVLKRKVKIQKDEDSTSESKNNVEEPEIIIENEEDSITKDDDGGDLRTALSRRRVQRLIKAESISGALPARILKSALQDAVSKRPSSKITKAKNGFTNSSDRRVLIVKRLSSTSQTFKATPNKKAISKESSTKLPIHMRLGTSQDIFVTETGVKERRVKRNRSGKRKRQPLQV